MASCKKCGSSTLFARRVPALEVTLRRPGLVYESYCPICAWCGGDIRTVTAEAVELRRQGQQLATG
jgi:hypothetical protein